MPSKLKSLVEKHAENADFRTGLENSEFIANIGESIRAMRERHGLTQSVLARTAGMNAPEISRLESGTLPRGPTVLTLKRLADACGESVDILLSGEKEQQTEEKCLTSTRLTFEALESKYLQAILAGRSGRAVGAGKARSVSADVASDCYRLVGTAVKKLIGHKVGVSPSSEMSSFVIYYPQAGKAITCALDHETGAARESGPKAYGNFVRTVQTAHTLSKARKKMRAQQSRLYRSRVSED
jgi:transcriptional regulator with XRE-family HTH domain